MKDCNPKCICAKKGLMCALKLSLIKQRESISDAAEKNKKACPAKTA